MITACIVTFHNDKTELKNAISSILKTTLDCILYIVDNSKDRSIESLCHDSRIEYIFNDSNVGFGAGHNIAIKKAQKIGSKNHYVINPDITFGTNILEQINSYMSTNEDIGLLMPKVVDLNGRLQFLCKLLPSPFDWIIRRILPIKSIKKRVDFKFEMRFTDYKRIIDVPFLSGCFMVFNMNIFSEIGYFDENIFMYCEDMDISRRVFSSSFRSVYYPEVTIIHDHKGGSKVNRKLLLYAIKSSIYYFNKWGWFYDKERSQVNKIIINKYL